MLQKSQVSASVLSYVFAIMSIFFASVCDVNSFLFSDFLGVGAVATAAPLFLARRCSQ